MDEKKLMPVVLKCMYIVIDNMWLCSNSASLKGTFGTTSHSVPKVTKKGNKEQPAKCNKSGGGDDEPPKHIQVSYKVVQK